MISINDLDMINETIQDVKDAKDKNIKAKVDLTLKDGSKLSIYHLGQANTTIRMDYKG